MHSDLYILKCMQLCTLYVDFISDILLHIMKSELLVLRVQAMAGAMVDPGKADFVKIIERLFWAIWFYWVARQAFANTPKHRPKFLKRIGNERQSSEGEDNLSDNICQGIKEKPTVEPSVSQNEAYSWKMTSEWLASTIALSAEADTNICGRS